LFPSAPLTVAQVDLLKRDNILATSASRAGDMVEKMGKRNIQNATAELSAI